MRGSCSGSGGKMGCRELVTPVLLIKGGVICVILGTALEEAVLLMGTSNELSPNVITPALLVEGGLICELNLGTALEEAVLLMDTGNTLSPNPITPALLMEGGLTCELNLGTALEKAVPLIDMHDELSLVANGQEPVDVADNSPFGK